jgi:aryl-alcohol dehydrogenase-like predicted oxidoreductase
MRRKPLGNSGIDVSVVGLGTNSFGMKIDAATARAVVDAAFDVGIDHFDTAEMYAGGDGERILGEALRGRRDQAFVATKFGGVSMGRLDGTARGAPERVHRAVDGSLERLGFDYVDMLYYHFPDGVTPLAETLGAMQEVVEAGKARVIGCSNVNEAHLRELDEATRASGKPGIVAIQNQYSLLERDDDAEVLPLAQELKISLVPYFPLVSGLLTGKYHRGQPPPEGSRLAHPNYQRLQMTNQLMRDDRFDQVERLTQYAEERRHTILELAISALVSMPMVASVLTGATSAEQVRQNVAAAEWELDADELAAIPQIESLGLQMG